MELEELVCENRLRQLCYEACEFKCRCCKPTDCDEQCVPEGSRFFAGARVALKELAVGEIYEVAPADNCAKCSFRPYEKCGLLAFCPTERDGGAALVRTKRP